MRSRAAILLVLVVACDAPTRAQDASIADPQRDAAAPDDAEAVDAASPDAEVVPDGAAPDGGATCASAPGDWAGTARRLVGGLSSTHQQLSVDVTWNRVSTTACVDHYQPSGTATFEEGSPCSTSSVTPSSVPIAPTDGELIIDRTTSPATFEVHGETRWTAIFTCDDDAPGPGPVGDVWADISGATDGAVIAGGILEGVAGGTEVEFRFARTDAGFTPPATCSEAAVDAWGGASSWGGNEATVTWARVSTEGCVDRFEPSGTASRAAAPTAGCVSRTYEPSSGPIAAADGYLEVDRSFDPPRFEMYGDTSWTSTITCTHADGSTETEQGPVGGWWALHTGELDGSTVSIRFASGPGESEHAWTLARP